jgi:glycosyltransferase involved in cell wall biosynthesis
LANRSVTLSVDSSPRKKVLMICYYFPPIRTVGSLRSAAFAKWLPAFGWDPTVLTVRNPRDRWVKVDDAPPDGTRVERSFEFDLFGLTELSQAVHSRIAKLLGKELKFNFLREYLCFPDPHISWFSTWRGIRLARNCDCIYVSCSPFSSLISGYLIQRWTGKPLVVDFRDTWSMNPHETPSRLRSFLTNKTEATVLARADWLIVNTAGAERVYKAKYPRFAAKISTVPNGYTGEVSVAEGSSGSADHFTIMYVGEFYGRRSPDRLLDVIRELNDPRIHFVQIGSNGTPPEKYSDMPNVSFLTSVKHAEALALMRSASLLYTTEAWEEGDQDYVAISQKTYEYLATGLPILADSPPGDNADLVRQYATRSYVATTGRKEDLKAAILQAINDGPPTQPSVSAEFAETFNPRNLTERLVKVLDHVS